jgi:hypothetical protein
MFKAIHKFASAGVFAFGVFAIAALAQQAQDPAKQGLAKPKRSVESQIRGTGFQYYLANVMGDASIHSKVARLPVQVVRDGVVSSMGEKEVATHLATAKAKFEASKLSDDERKQVFQNMIGLFDQADISYIGADTAILTFVIRPGKTADQGDYLCGLTLFQSQGAWRVIGEITDSKSVPLSYFDDIAPIKPGDVKKP